MRSSLSHIILSWAVALVAVSGAHAAPHEGGTARRPCLRYHEAPRAEWRGDSLSLRFSGRFYGRLKATESLHVIPLYIAGGDTVRYPEAGYYTPSVAKFVRRRAALSGTETGGRVRVLRRKDSGETDYRETKLVPASAGGRFVLRQELRDCCSSRLLASDMVAVPERTVAKADTVYITEYITDTVRTTVSEMLPLPVAAVSLPLFETNVSFIRPQAEPEKMRTMTTTIRITYPVNHWRVYPNHGDNEDELHRIDSLLTPIAGDTATYRITTAEIVGYASPEDTYEHNMELSRKRADAMRDYLRGRYRLPADKFTAEGRGEDWEGLREAVAVSNMPSRKEVLEIIDTYGIFNGREKRLMDLHGGVPYKYMLANLYPPLRRMEMKMDYSVRAFRASEAARLIGSRPQDLSLQEMYEAARAENSDRTITKGRDEYGREYDIAVRYFPDNDIANINASSAALVRGDLELAWLCLGKVKENPLAYNNLGVYHWICGEAAKAREYFEKAKETDPVRAAYNLEQLDRWEAEFDKKEGRE